MKTIVLACTNCDAQLQINNAVAQLACANCGETLRVERKGGAIVLVGAQSADPMQTAAMQTAAELALARLARELDEASVEVGILQYEEERLVSSFKQSDLLSDAAADSISDRVAKLKVTVEQRWLPPLVVLYWLTAILGCYLMVSEQNGLPRKIGAFVLIVVASFAVYAVCVMIIMAIKVSREETLHKLEKQLERHRMAVSYNQELKDVQGRLPDASASVRRIRDEIQHHRKVVQPPR